jgi:hypothetical protein
MGVASLPNEVLSSTSACSSAPLSASDDEQQQQQLLLQQQSHDICKRERRKKFLLFLTVLMRVIDEKMVRDQVKILVKSIVRNDTKNRRRRRRQRGCRCRCHCSSGCGSSDGRGHCELPSPAFSEQQSQQDYSTPSILARSATGSSLSSSCHGSSEALIEAIESPLRALVGDSVWVVACHYTELNSRKYVQPGVITIAADKDSVGVDSREHNDQFPNSNDDDARR